MTVAETPAVGFGAAERTLDGADHVALTMSDLALADEASPGAASLFFASAAHELLSALVFCAAHGDRETTRTLETWVSTATTDRTEQLLLARLRDMVDAPASTTDQRRDARRAMQRLVKWMGRDRAAQTVQTTALIAIRDWATLEAKERTR